MTYAELFGYFSPLIVALTGIERLGEAPERTRSDSPGSGGSESITVSPARTRHDV